MVGETTRHQRNYLLNSGGGCLDRARERERVCVWGALFSIVRDGRDGT